ncbi:MAG TPA: 50S ribosomal protein L5 [Nitrospiraceae bacterium]|nr:50S ribosomal protein L5 [Nitrospiraceae bacterium]
MADKKDTKKDTKGGAKNSAAAVPKKAAKAPAKAAKKDAKKAAPSAEAKAAAPARPKEAAPAQRLREKYLKTVVPALIKEFSYSSSMQAPKIVKIVLNVGMGEAITNAKALDHAVDELGRITGQRPVVTRAKKSIANYKLREGMPIGCSVTLRRARMYEFLDRLISAALPRIRDFKGVSPKSFDGRGNYSMGVKEQVIFPEIEIDKIDSIHGMDIAIVTTAKTDEEGRALLGHFGMPFRK